MADNKPGVRIDSRVLATRLNQLGKLETGAKVIAGRQRGTQMVPEAKHVQGIRFVSPEKRYLLEYEGAYRNDPYIHDGINKLVLSMLASLGPYINSDQRAVDYVNAIDRHMEGNIRDELGQLSRSFAQMQQRLLTDQLTGLSNRTAVLRRIEERILQHRRRGDTHPFAVMFVDRSEEHTS